MSGWHVVGDWGSSRMRLWRVRDGIVEDRQYGPGIIGRGTPPASALRDAIASWLGDGPPDAITLCGMAGARGGLHEAPYAQCPLTAEQWREATVQFTFDGIPVGIAAGCADGDADVMRGEEAQVFGAPTVDPALGQGRSVIVLPGTHAKWVWVTDGAITGFRTMLTGELFKLLQSSSLFAFGGGEGLADDAGFAAGVARAGESSGLLGELFTLRAAQLLRGRSAGWAREYLSGLLIGAEIAEVRRSGCLPGAVSLIGDATLAERYARALAASGVTAHLLDAEACTLAGLRLILEG